ncbi:hypothetical protein OSO01_24600 [Oceanobacillus sojae]|uniref:Uncharacterized protein n=1 Tax=Oceanobacillus sojae TaxID=582851 RepID=A0A511ZJU5_9BACI|nr:hypothetical protein OSO01_24600 [Oceanobacillus sojae]
MVIPGTNKIKIKDKTNLNRIPLALNIFFIFPSLLIVYIYLSEEMRENVSKNEKFYKNFLLFPLKR